MVHALCQWPKTVYPDEIERFPEALEAIDVALRELSIQGPSPLGYNVKNLGKTKDNLWQLNLKVEKRQIRVLYAPYRNTIVVFDIHKKGSPQEQQRAYKLAMKRKREAELQMKAEGSSDDSLHTLH